MAQVLATDSVVNNALLPDTLERPAYVLVVQVVLHLLQECLGYLDGSRFFRRALTVQQSHSSVAALKHSGLALDAAMIEAIAARTSSSQAAPITSQRVGALSTSAASASHCGWLQTCSPRAGSSRCWASRWRWAVFEEAAHYY